MKTANNYRNLLNIIRLNTYNNLKTKLHWNFGVKMYVFSISVVLEVYSWREAVNPKEDMIEKQPKINEKNKCENPLFQFSKKNNE